MTDPTSLFDALGPVQRHPAVRAFCLVSKDCFDLFHDSMGGRKRSDETPRQHLTTRMLFISEMTSAAIRLNATWGLSIPAMSLVRDRYEQVVRHSWLMHQSDNTEMIKYVAWTRARKPHSQEKE